jgi:hypothetical protein
MANDPGDRAESEAFVMPELPAALKLDPDFAALRHVMAFLELSGDGAVDPDAAVRATEHVGHYLRQLPAGRVASMRDQISRKAGWGTDAVEFLAGFLDNSGVGGEDE